MTFHCARNWCPIPWGFEERVQENQATLAVLLAFFVCFDGQHTSAVELLATLATVMLRTGVDNTQDLLPGVCVLHEQSLGCLSYKLLLSWCSGNKLRVNRHENHIVWYHIPIGSLDKGGGHSLHEELLQRPPPAWGTPLVQ